MDLKHQLENSQITLDDVKHKIKTKSDVILIGAGIMSATLGIFLKELDPTLTIAILERMDSR
jgi:malate dehydrogenase (quinone)